jgi:hypothetical protein
MNNFDIDFDFDQNLRDPEEMLQPRFNIEMDEKQMDFFEHGYQDVIQDMIREEKKDQDSPIVVA